MLRLVSFAFVSLMLAMSVAACIGPSEPAVATPPRDIAIAYDPSKARLFEDLVNTYNGKATIKVRGLKMETPQLLDALPKGEMVGVSPDSSIWLENLDKAWEAGHPGAPSIVGTTVRYAATPVVIALWRGSAGGLGPADQQGWASLLRKGSEDSSFHWSHGSPRASASGMLALVAEFYAGAGKTYGLTKDDADREDVRRYVTQIEKTIARYGGEGDAALVEYLLKEGQKALSATVMPEASVFDFNQRSRSAKLDAIYPAEGTLMLDHPLVLLETPELTPDQRRAFLEFSRFLTGPDGQAIVVKHGFRSVDLAFDMAKSPLKNEGLSIEQPRLLQMPAAGTLAYLRTAWAYGLKRRANIVIVADVSGSMEGDKLTRAKEALGSFIKQAPSDEERIGLVTFSSDYQEAVALDRLGANRGELLRRIDGLAAGGNTALYYATWRAHRLLAQRRDAERINVVVVMTDGNENASRSFSERPVVGIGLVPRIATESSSDIGPLVAAMKREGQNILVFAVAYGSDADLNMLSSLAGAFGGQAYRADPDTIRRLYELISQNF